MSKKKKIKDVDWGLDDIREIAGIIESTFEAFGIRTKVREVNVLSKSIQYCLEIEVGNKIDDIKKLNKDIALAVSSSTGKIKIKAPIPNTNYVGIYVPKRRKAKGKEFYIITANDKAVKIRDLNLLVAKFSKRRLNMLVNDAINFIYRNKFDVVGIILLQEELKIKPKEAIVLFKELCNMELIINVRSEEGKSGVMIGDVDRNFLKTFMIN